MLILLIILLVVLGGGGGYYARGPMGGGIGLGGILIIIFVLYLLGVIH